MRFYKTTSESNRFKTTFKTALSHLPPAMKVFKRNLFAAVFLSTTILLRYCFWYGWVPNAISCSVVWDYKLFFRFETNMLARQSLHKSWCNALKDDVELSLQPKIFLPYMMKIFWTRITYSDVLCAVLHVWSCAKSVHASLGGTPTLNENSIFSLKQN